MSAPIQKHVRSGQVAAGKELPRSRILAGQLELVAATSRGGASRLSSECHHRPEHSDAGSTLIATSRFSFVSVAR